MTDYDAIPTPIRHHLDDLYLPEGVTTWWNSRNRLLDDKSPRQVWHTQHGRARVWQIVEMLETGAVS